MRLEFALGLCFDPWSEKVIEYVHSHPDPLVDENNIWKKNQSGQSCIILWFVWLTCPDYVWISSCVRRSVLRLFLCKIVPPIDLHCALLRVFHQHVEYTIVFGLSSWATQSIWHVETRSFRAHQHATTSITCMRLFCSCLLQPLCVRVCPYLVLKVASKNWAYATASAEDHILAVMIQEISQMITPATISCLSPDFALCFSLSLFEGEESQQRATGQLRWVQLRTHPHGQRHAPFLVRRQCEEVWMRVSDKEPTDDKKLANSSGNESSVWLSSFSVTVF